MEGPDWLRSSQGMREGPKTQLISSPQAVLKAAAILGLFWNSLLAFFPLGHHLNWLSESLLPLQVPAESTGSSDLCKSDQVGPLGLSG